MYANLPLSVINGQPLSVKDLAYLPRMGTDIKTIARKNILKLLVKTKPLVGKETGISRLRDLGMAQTNAQRLLDDGSDPRMSRIEEAAALLEVEPWQLLVPDFDPDNLPELSGSTKPWPFHMVDEKRYEALTHDGRVFVQSKLDSAIAEQEQRGASHQARIGNGG